MAFTITSIGTSATAAGTTGNDAANIAGFAVVDVTGLAGEDVITIGSVSASSVDMAEGNDTVFGNVITGSTIALGDGIDFASVSSLAAGAVLKGGKGADTLRVTTSVNASEVRGGKGADTITVSNDVWNNGSVRGGKGSDFINVLSDVSAGGSVLGGDGNDVMFVATLNTSASGIFGGAGNDTITWGGFGNVYGDDGDDLLSGSGNVYGGTGNDTFVLGSSGSRYFGQDGSDTFQFSATTTNYGTIQSYQAGVDQIDITGGLDSYNGGTNVVFQADGNVGLNTTVYEISAALTAGNTISSAVSALFFGAGATATTGVNLEIVAYQAGNIAQLFYVSDIEMSNGVVSAFNVTLNATLTQVTAGSLSAADFV